MYKKVQVDDKDIDISKEESTNLDEESWNSMIQISLVKKEYVNEEYPSQDHPTKNSDGGGVRKDQVFKET